MSVQGHPNTDRSRVQRVQEVLADPHRRNVLRELAALAGEDVRFERLVERIAQYESEDSERIASDLHHIHLPKLANLGVITYDPATRHITHHTCRVADVLSLASEALERR